jgi:hypothetical protein
MSSTRTHNSFFLGAVAAVVVALVAVVAALLLLAYNANPAQAAGDCSATSGTTTCTYVSTGAEDTFVVPAGVSRVHVFAVGAPGAAGDFYPINGASPAPGGAGARVSGNLTGLTTGDTLYVNVGGAPTGGDDCAAGINCNGGFNGGGNSGGGNLIASTGGGGGGASDVRTQPRTVPLASDDSRLIVAAGGGGGGAGGLCRDLLDPELQQPLLGGTGGVAGGFLDSDGGDGEPCVVELGTLPYILSGGKGGKEGTQSAGGAGGAGGTETEFGSGLDGESGSLGQGGSGAGSTSTSAGGGGGGGYYGGGGGGASADCQNDGVCADFWSGAGGGGGGSSLVPTTGGEGPLITGLSPSIVISYQGGGVGEPPPPTEQPQTKEDCKKGGWKEFGFKNQGQCIKAVNHPS